MDKIWDSNPLKSEVIGCCGGDENPNDQTEPTTVECYKKYVVFKTLTHTCSLQRMHAYLLNSQ